MIDFFMAQEIGKARQRELLAEVEHDRLVRLVTANSKHVSKTPGWTLALGSLVLSTLIAVQMFVS